MCGIAGIWWRDGGTAPWTDLRERLHAMSAVLHHRGPDDSGSLARAGAGLAFARLSIIDLVSGHQPMQTPDGRHAIVFNGEVYNFQSLRPALAQGGYDFSTHSDTEVILAGFARYGAAYVHELRGMFGLAIHDEAENELLLLRDRLGIKPLYYAEIPQGLVFASEIKGILASGLVAAEIDAEAFCEVLTYGHVCAPRTIYRGIRALLPGHRLRARRERIEVDRYWQVRREPSSVRTLAEAAEQAEELLREAVRLRLISDVPFGALLSGGIDSGLVVALMAQLHSEPIRTFSIGFEEERYDELPWARAVAKRYGTRHTEVVCRPDVAELAPKLAVAHDQPFGDSSAIPTAIVCEIARRDVTVALSGDGGDEVFAGYRRHTQWVREAMTAQRRSPLRPMARLVSTVVAPSAPGGQRLRRLGLDAEALQVDSLVLSEPRLVRELAGPKLSEAARRGSLEVARAAGGEFAAQADLARFQHQDLTHYLPNDVLTKVDIASMQHSLEVRVPMLDHQLVPFGLNLPPQFKNDGTHGKLVLRELARKHLPPEHLTKRKSGFGLPVAEWLRGPLRGMMGDLLGHSQLAQAGWLAQPVIDRLVQQHLAGRSRSSLLWILLMSELWMQSRGGR